MTGKTALEVAEKAGLLPWPEPEDDLDLGYLHPSSWFIPFSWTTSQRFAPDSSEFSVDIYRRIG